MNKVQEQPNYYIAANFKYKYQAQKALTRLGKLLADDSSLTVVPLRTLPLHCSMAFLTGELLSNWFVCVAGTPTPSLDMEKKLVEAMKAAKGVLVKFDDMQLHELLASLMNNRTQL